ncbi:hypothetical protein E2562_022425 [Oryza meyeriana var. granulata]|uniref:Uncharacterized protein n=1 Tax=Oryza meyeriana var. granulata TaxID=110450 RepID=A0A6G1BN09_9ORYZ|nr:hypothetical protein E2562_022425 [Oryza meyeriana var. granulata]
MAYVGKEDGRLGATYGAGGNALVESRVVPCFKHSFVAVDSVGDDVLSQAFSSKTIGCGTMDYLEIVTKA